MRGEWVQSLYEIEVSDEFDLIIFHLRDKVIELHQSRECHMEKSLHVDLLFIVYEQFIDRL